VQKRYDELDSLRGLAASTVLLSHLFIILPSIYLINEMRKTPIHIFWAGHEAVILFFVLSGFVLSLPFFRDKIPKYRDYLIKRFCRIYIPYFVAISISIICMLLFSRTGITELSNWFNAEWTTPLSFGLLIQHIFLIGEFKTQSFNGVIWSLVHEMRISIIFPFLMYSINKYDWKRNIIIALSCSSLYFLIFYFILKVYKYDISSLQSSYFATIHYISFFILGSLLAKNIQFINVYYMKIINKGVKISLFIFAILAYTYSSWFPSIFLSHIVIVDDWSIAIGGSIFIIFCLNSNIIRKIMLLKPVHFVGKISYSLYLYHMIIMFTLIHVFYGKLPIGLILFSSLVLSFVIASIMYFAIEKSSIKLGKSLTTKKPPTVKTNLDAAKRTEEQLV
jgi:peptidoglycan/LPS O-acetylase OafA/YrhL